MSLIDFVCLFVFDGLSVAVHSYVCALCPFLLFACHDQRLDVASVNYHSLKDCLRSPTDICIGLEGETFVVTSRGLELVFDGRWRDVRVRLPRNIFS